MLLIRELMTTFNDFADHTICLYVSASSVLQMCQMISWLPKQISVFWWSPAIESITTQMHLWPDQQQSLRSPNPGNATASQLPVVSVAIDFQTFSMCYLNAQKSAHSRSYFHVIVRLRHCDICGRIAELYAPDMGIWWAYLEIWSESRLKLRSHRVNLAPMETVKNLCYTSLLKILILRSNRMYAGWRPWLWTWK